MRRFLSSLLPLALVCFMSQAQQIFSSNTYPLVDFRPPLNISPPALSGSFGELRANHFHSGLDFRTNQREGYPVFAIADGYISRIRVQNSGFGLAVYIDHPNGFTSVYAHLQRFNAKIGKQAKSLQYKKESFEIDEFSQRDAISVHKGEIIGYSGNTGSSGGPHLHFEIRDTKSEATINPQLFGINIPDNIPPTIYSLYVYQLDGKPFNETIPKKNIDLVGSPGSYSVKNGGPLMLGGEVGFGIVVNDRHAGASGKNGVYSIELELDGEKVYTSSMERFSFENSRAINSHIDYPTYQKTKISIQKSFVDPGNPLQIYHGLINSGRILLTDGKPHTLKYTITDARGNKSVLPFHVIAKEGSAYKVNKSAQLDGTFLYDQTNEFFTDNVKAILPKGTLYNNLDFKYQFTAKPSSNAFSPVHKIHTNLTPLHKGFELWIKPDSSLNKYKDKALIVNVNRVSQGGNFEDGFVKANPRTFGEFFVTIDTIAPTIIPLNIAAAKSSKGVGKMSFKIRDNLSGIKSFNGYIDGKWVLMEFDAKSATVWHTFDPSLSSVKHSFVLIVTDMKNNTKRYSINFNI